MKYRDFLAVTSTQRRQQDMANLLKRSGRVFHFLRVFFHHRLELAFSFLSLFTFHNFPVGFKQKFLHNFRCLHRKIYHSFNRVTGALSYKNGWLFVEPRGLSYLSNPSARARYDTRSIF